MKTSLIAGTLAIAMGGLLLTPQASRAGDDEWATAGKILTGAVILHILGGTGGTHHSTYRKTYTTHVSRPPARCAPRHRVHRRWQSRADRSPTHCDSRRSSREQTTRIIIVERENERHRQRAHDRRRRNHGRSDHCR